MSGKSQQKLLTEFLNLPGVLVKAYRAYEGIGFILQLEAVQQQASCPSCGLKSEKLHQNHWYLVKDLPISSQPVYLRVNRRQLKCMQCRKPFSEELSYVSKNRTYTKRLAKEIVQQVLDNDIRSVAQRNDVSEEEIETMLKQVLAGIKKSKYALLKNEKDLNEQQKEKLNSVKQVAPLLARMHQLKEEFRLIFEQAENWGEGLLKLSDWLKVAAPEFPESRKTIVRWLGEIVGYFERRTTQGIVEGINNKIKLIKRSAYGFRNFENFRRRTLLSWHFNC